MTDYNNLSDLEIASLAISRNIEIWPNRQARYGLIRKIVNRGDNLALAAPVAPVTPVEQVILGEPVVPMGFQIVKPSVAQVVETQTVVRVKADIAVLFYNKFHLKSKFKI